MFKKCYGCDKKGEQTIDVEVDDYIVVKKQAFHTQCYINKLVNAKRKPISLEEAQTIANEIKVKQQAEWAIKEKARKEKDDFFQLLINYYDMTLPTKYYIKVASVVDGSLQGLRRPISYVEMLEMYDNPKFRHKLEKARRKKNKEMKQPYYYDLAILISEYDIFRKYKEKQKDSRLQNEEYDRIMEEYKKKMPTKQKETTKKRSEDDDIMALIDKIF